MPFVHVRSLPVADGFDATAAARAVSASLSREAGVEEEHVTVTWQTLDAHVEGGREAPAGVLVDLHAPDFHAAERIDVMLRSVAGAVAREAGVADDRVFVSFRPAHSGQVFDRGAIVRW